MKWPLRALLFIISSLCLGLGLGLVLSPNLDLELGLSSLVLAQDEVSKEMQSDNWPSPEVPLSVEPRQEEPLPQSYNQKLKIDPRAAKEQKVPHPFAKKGLVRITHDKVYFYRIKKSDQKYASSLRFGFFDLSNLTNLKAEVASSSIYPKSNGTIIFYDYEWQLWKKFGKLGWKLGTGLYFAKGNGKFKIKSYDSLTPKEEFTFIIVPNSISAIYRLQFWDTQSIVPYIEGGGDVITFAETRNDGKPTKFGLASAAHVAAGASLNLGLLNTASLINLDREYGINNIWLTSEFRALLGLSGQFDFTTNIINLGVLVEF